MGEVGTGHHQGVAGSQREGGGVRRLPVTAADHPVGPSQGEEVPPGAPGEASVDHERGVATAPHGFEGPGEGLAAG